MREEFEQQQQQLQEIKQQGVQQNMESGPQIPVLSTHNPETRIAQALFKLSSKDRNAIEEEVHGVSCMAPEETPELLHQSLYEFHSELAKIPHKIAYNRAQELLAGDPPGRPPSYIHTSGYKLRFLRCELFDAAKAATRYVKYLDMIFELYGETALQRPIRLKDMDRDEMNLVKEGRYQLLPVRDRSGRRILCGVSNSITNHPSEVILRVILYLCASALGLCDVINNDFDSIETQQKGLVFVYLPKFQELQADRTLESSLLWIKQRFDIILMVVNIIPVRVCAVHACLPNKPLAKAIHSLITAASLMSRFLPRTKFHFGDPVELRYQLQGYGIPTDNIPSTDTGNVKSVNLKSWIKMRAHLEWQVEQYRASLESDGGDESIRRSSSSQLGIPPYAYIIECPRSNDVTFRRGKSMMHHPGNAKFLNLIEHWIYEHTIDPRTPPFRRTEIEKELIQTIRDDGGRFLKWEIDKCWWVDMSAGANGEKEIQSKVHYAFRDFRKRMMKIQQKRIDNTSSTYAFARQDGQKRKRYGEGTDVVMEDCDSCGKMEDGFI